MLLDCLIVHNLLESIPSHYEVQFCSLILSLDALKSVFLTELSAMILDGLLVSKEPVVLHRW